MKNYVMVVNIRVPRLMRPGRDFYTLSEFFWQSIFYRPLLSAVFPVVSHLYLKVLNWTKKQRGEKEGKGGKAPQFIFAIAKVCIKY